MSFSRKILRLLMRPLSGKWLYILSLEINDKITLYKRQNFKRCGLNLQLASSAFIMSPMRVSIGNNCIINEYVHILGGGGVELGNGVWIANHASIVSSTHPTDVEYIGDHPQLDSPVLINDNVWIGSHAVILPGVTLGKSCVVGAGSVVTKDIPPYAIVAGVPAKVIRFKTICSDTSEVR